MTTVGPMVSAWYVASDGIAFLCSFGYLQIRSSHCTFVVDRLSNNASMEYVRRVATAILAFKALRVNRNSGLAMELSTPSKHPIFA